MSLLCKYLTKTIAAICLIFVTCYNDIGNMADGVQTYFGAVACPAWLRLGTTVNIVGLGNFTCHDRYSSTLSDRFDIAVPGASLDTCYSYTGVYEWSIVTNG